MRHLVVASAFDMVAERIQRFFSHRGFHVERVDGGIECLGSLKRTPPDVLVLDWNLPWGGGAGVLACLRENEATAMVPVVLLADRYPSQVDVHAPVTRCLKVPADVRLLYDVVNSVLDYVRRGSPDPAETADRRSSLRFPAPLGPCSPKTSRLNSAWLN